MSVNQNSTLRLIIVTGLPGSGKTEIGKRIAREFSFPIVHKDDIKELLFDRLGWKDRSWSKKRSLASYDLMTCFLESQLSAGKSCIAEANFRAGEHEDRFNLFVQKYHCQIIQILCFAEGPVLWERFQNRKRHPGHVDVLTHDEMKPALLEEKPDPIQIKGKVIRIDTTDFKKVDYQGLFEEIRGLTLLD